MINSGAWDDEEVKTLFKFIEVKKSEGVPLIKCFCQFAKCVGRQANSVRNYYYSEIKNLLKNQERSKKLNIELKKHITKEAEPFSSEETKRIVERVETLLSNGYSVRRACLTLADGDATKMIRYQNKYRLETKYKKVDNKMNNIIKMPNRKTAMTDEDIKALFMGILTLVKKQEMERARMSFENELDIANKKLKTAMAEIIIKTAKIEKLQSEMRILEGKDKENKKREIEYRIKLAQNGRAKELLNKFMAKRGAIEKIPNQCI